MAVVPCWTIRRCSPCIGESVSGSNWACVSELYRRGTLSNSRNTVICYIMLHQDSVPVNGCPTSDLAESQLPIVLQVIRDMNDHGISPIALQQRSRNGAVESNHWSFYPIRRHRHIFHWKPILHQICQLNTYLYNSACIRGILVIIRCDIKRPIIPVPAVSGGRSINTLRRHQSRRNQCWKYKGQRAHPDLRLKTKTDERGGYEIPTVGPAVWSAENKSKVERVW